MADAHAALARRLLAWYRASRRDLAWRRTSDPYRVWVSEVMLQQTRVEVVEPYYTRFLDAFPTLEALAAAPLDAVLALWSGLGYYDRPRSLHAAVRECREGYGGRVPEDPEAFGSLRGVGPYTRAAVLSIAYGAPLAAVDGNVVRVISRLFALAGHAKEPRLRARVQEIATELLPRADAGDFNQAVMELGAMVCTPRAPRCDVCPLAAGCEGLASGDPLRYPAAAPRKAPRAVVWHASLLRKGGSVLLARRGETGRFKGMWELPWSDAGPAGLRARLGGGLVLGPEIARVRHSVLDERITLVVHAGRLARKPRDEPSLRWVETTELGALGMASVWRKALVAAGAGDRATALAPATRVRATAVSRAKARDVRGR